MATILVIDDSYERLSWFQTHLERLGHSVRLATDAASALDQFRESAFDLVFSDHDLGPGMNGSQMWFRVFQSVSYKVPGSVWVHSSNPVGVKNIVAKCRSAEVPCMSAPFESFSDSAESFEHALLSWLGRVSSGGITPSSS